MKKNCKQCKKLKKIDSYSGKCSACLNPHARVMGKLSAMARKGKTDYVAMGKKSALSRKRKIKIGDR